MTEKTEKKHNPTPKKGGYQPEDTIAGTNPPKTIKPKKEKIIARVDDIFYNRCVEKLSDAFKNQIFKGDTNLGDNILLKDVLIVLGGYLRGCGVSISSLLDDDFDAKIFRMMDDMESLWFNNDFDLGAVLAAMGTFIHVVGKEIGVITESNELEGYIEEKEKDENE
jgi:hypothetical protein